MNKKEVKTCLGILYGNKCFVTDSENNITLHHLRKREHGGETSIQNGVLLNEDFHRWVHRLEITDYCYFVLLNETISVAKEVIKGDEAQLKEKVKGVKDKILDRYYGHGKRTTN